MTPTKVDLENIEKLRTILEEQTKTMNLLVERTAKYGMLDTPLKLQEELAKQEMDIDRIKRIKKSLELQRQLVTEHKFKLTELKLETELQQMRQRTTIVISSILALFGIIIGVSANIISDSLTNKLGIDINLGVLLGVISGLLLIIITIWVFSRYRELQETETIKHILSNQKIVTEKEVSNSTMVAKGEI